MLNYFLLAFGAACLAAAVFTVTQMQLLTGSNVWLACGLTVIGAGCALGALKKIIGGLASLREENN